MCKHLSTVLASLRRYNVLKNSSQAITLTGENLDVATLVAVSNNHFKSVRLSEDCKKEMAENVEFLTNTIDKGVIIYGVNTGYGGSADVRSSNTEEMQTSLVDHLLCGFAYYQKKEIIRAVMFVRANSLAKACSGIRGSTVDLLLSMLNFDLLPRVPLRGTVSSSGDLSPTAYIAATMSGRKDAVVYLKGEKMTATEALAKCKLEPVKFQSKEALAVVNASSFSSSVGCVVMFSGDVAVLLTQLSSCLAVEAMNGRIESFHPNIANLLPHKGFQEASKNLYSLLKNSRLTEQRLTIDCEDDPARLKQDRYCLRSAGQWLSPVLETMVASRNRLEIEINSANDNPLINHRHQEILHAANFQGINTTVAMDQARQSLQLCGKLLFAQFEEMVNINLNVGLSPNLCGGHYNTDFGFKGLDAAMASYCSELDSLTTSMTGHILAAELHNQSINSMALVSARKTREALEILQMMISSNLLASCQAIDLRILSQKIQHVLRANEITNDDIPWYAFLNASKSDYSQVKFANNKKSSLEKLEREICEINNSVGSDIWIENVSNNLGDGTKHLYKYIRKELKIAFYRFGDTQIDVSLEKIHELIKNGEIQDIILHIFEKCNLDDQID